MTGLLSLFDATAQSEATPQRAAFLSFLRLALERMDGKVEAATHPKERAAWRASIERLESQRLAFAASDRLT